MRKIWKSHTTFFPLERLLTVLLCITVTAMGLQNNYSADLGFHLRSAKWILDHKQLLYTDEFTYTSERNAYYDLSWLFQLFEFGIFSLGKNSALVIVNTLLIAFSFSVVCIRLRSITVDYLSLLCLIVLILFGTQGISFEIRPQVFTLLFLNAFLLALWRYKQGRDDTLKYLPFLMLIWTNTHSLSILGIITLLIFFFGMWLENGHYDKKLLKAIVLSVVLCLANPYFTKGIAYPFSQFGMIAGHSLQKMYISELQSPFSLTLFREEGLAYFLHPLFNIQVYSIFSLLIALRLFFKRKYTECLLIVSFFFLCALAVRNFALLFIVSLPFVANDLSDWLRSEKYTVLFSKVRSGLIAAALCVTMIVMTFNDGLSLLHNTPFTFGVSEDKDALPVEATEFLNKNGLRGKIMNHLDFGGYLAFHHPDKIFIDGRLETQKTALTSKYYRSLYGNGFDLLVKEYNPDIIIFPYIKAVKWWSCLLKSPEYRPVYFDGLAAIYVKNEKFTKLKTLTSEIVTRKSREVALCSLGDLTEIKKPNRLCAALSSLWQKQYYPSAEQNRAAFCFTSGYHEAGLNYLLRGLEKSTFHLPNTYLYLSQYFKQQNKFSESEICAAMARL